jgi:hypothetical protein
VLTCPTVFSACSETGLVGLLCRWHLAWQVRGTSIAQHSGMAHPLSFPNQQEPCSRSAYLHLSEQGNVPIYTPCAYVTGA